MKHLKKKCSLYFAIHSNSVHKAANNHKIYLLVDLLHKLKYIIAKQENVTHCDITLYCNKSKWCQLLLLFCIFKLMIIMCWY